MPKSPQAEFPVDLIRPRGGSLYIGDRQPGVSVELMPFTIDGEVVEQTLDFTLEIGATDLKDLAGREFEFPSNPEDGYVEGSIYIWSAHNPIDLHSITFGDPHDDVVSVTLDMTFVFEFEGDRKNLRATLPVDLCIKRE